LYDERATKTAILRALRDMITSSSLGDHLLFHYSGHGAQIASSDLDEPDGLDECLCPVDFSWNDRSTAFTDNELGALLATVPAGTAMTVLLDSCHSGDMSKALADRIKAEPRCLKPPPDVAHRLHGKRVIRHRAIGRSNAVVISACRDSETAADTSFDGRPN